MTSNPSWSVPVTPKSEIIAEIYAQALQANGFDVGRRMESVAERRISRRSKTIPSTSYRSTSAICGCISKLTQCNHAGRRRVGALQEAAGGLSILTPSPASDTDTISVTSATAGSGI